MPRPPGEIPALALLSVLRGRLHPVGGLGVALGATVLLFPVVQPWYLLCAWWYHGSYW